MNKIKTNFKGLFIIEGKNNIDNRGLLREIFKKKIINKNFLFDYYSISKKNVIRGLHFQKKNQQAKFIIVLKGEILDFCLDLRKNSKTFLKVFKTKLSEKNRRSIYIPEGFAHGFIGVAKENIVLYKNTNYRDIKNEIGINFFDNKLKIKIKKRNLIVSTKDRKNISLNEFLKKYKSL